MTQRRRMSRAAVERTPYADCPLCFGAGVIHNWEVDRPCMRCFERRAVERTGRVLVAWLIGRWRR